MDREDIIRMAREAGASEPNSLYGRTDYVVMTHHELERFAALVAARERNKLAAWMIQYGFPTGHGDTMEQLCDALGTEIVDRIEMEVVVEREECIEIVATHGGSVEIEAAIRARGEK